MAGGNAEEEDVDFGFADLYCKVVPLLAKAVTADTLKRYLGALRHMPSNQLYISPSLYQHCTSVEEILDVLQRELYFHHSHINLLRNIVNTHGCSECKRLLQNYESRTTSHKRSRKNLSEEEIDGSSSTKKVKVKLGGESVVLGINIIETVQEELERTSEVSRDMIIFGKEETGSILLTFLIPATMEEAFINISKSEEHLSDLAAIGIQSIEIGEVTIDVEAYLDLERIYVEGAYSREIGDPTEIQHGLLPAVSTSYSANHAWSCYFLTVV